MMNDQFQKALEHTLKFEGGYANDPDDSGGETFRGVSRRNWPGWPGWPLIDEAKRQGNRSAKAINARFEGNAEMERLIAEFYHQNFWRPFERLEAPGYTTAKLFDTAVNVGVGGAVKILQRVINKMGPISQIEVDGKIGPRTIAAFDLVTSTPAGINLLMHYLVAEQEAHYRRIVQRKASQAKYLKGWLRRANWLPVQI